jgi:hypothetical protein
MVTGWLEPVNITMSGLQKVWPTFGFPADQCECGHPTEEDIRSSSSCTVMSIGASTRQEA